MSCRSLISELLLHLQEQKEVFTTAELAVFFAEAPPKKIETKPITPLVLPSIPPPIKKALPPPPKIEPVVPSLPKPVKELPTTDFSLLRKLVSTVAPHVALIDEIPHDAIAHKMANRWQTKNQAAPISIISFAETEEQKKFLEEIAIAVDVYFGPAKIVQGESIEKENQWAHFLSVAELKWIIICDYTLWQLHQLIPFYKENPTQATKHLGKIPVFLLPDLSLYSKDPKLKRSLWNALQQKLGANGTGC